LTIIKRCGWQLNSLVIDDSIDSMQSPESGGLQCPYTGDACESFPVCAAKLLLLGEGVIESAEFLQDYPEHKPLVQEVFAIMNREFCSKIIIESMWDIANDPRQHDFTRRAAASFADDIAIVRAEIGLL